jgi:hypothetical protein
LALSFDGVDDLVDHGDINALDGTAVLTTSLWVSLNAGVAVNDGFWSKGNTFGVGISGSAADELQGHGNLGGAERWRTTDANLVAGPWYHVGAIYNGAAGTNATRFRLFLDGVEKTLTFDTAVPATLDVTATAVVTGQNTVNSAEFPGRIAHLRIWNVALTPAQLLQEMHSYRPGVTAGLVLWSPYDDGVAGRDLSGAGNHGAVTGALQMAGPPIGYGAPQMVA